MGKSGISRNPKNDYKGKTNQEEIQKKKSERTNLRHWFSPASEEIGCAKERAPN